MDLTRIKISINRLTGIALFTVLLGQSPVALSEGFRLTPLKLYFDSKSSSASLKINNDSHQKINLQLEAMAWHQSDEGEDLYSPSREIIFFPKILSIDANSERVVRVGFQGAPAGDKEKSFRLFVQELPADTSGETRMKFAVRLSIPVFVRPIEDTRAWSVDPISMDRQGLRIRVKNTGSRFLMVGDMQAIGRGSDGNETFRSADRGWYVLAGQRRGFALPMTRETCEIALTMEVAITVDKETRKQTLSDIDCESLDPNTSQATRTSAGK